MNGRLENEIKIENAINNLLYELPNYVTEWYMKLRSSKKTMSCCRDYIRKVKDFLRFIDSDYCNIDSSMITLLNVQKFYISKQTKKDSDGNTVYTSDSYQSTLWFCLNSFLEFLYKQSYIDENYMSYVDKPKVRDLDRINRNRILLTKNDFADIIHSVNNGAGTKKAKQLQKPMKYRDLSILYIFMTTGLRRTALSEINIGDIDFENNRLIITDKGDKEQEYYLDDNVLDVLYKWMDRRGSVLKGKNTDALFVSYQGTRMSGTSIYKLVKKYCYDALGLEISPHKLRAAFCSILYEEKHDIEFVRRAVGHSNIQTTQRYIVTDNEERVESASIIASIF